MPKLRTLSTVDAIVDELGGNYKLVKALGTSSQAVSNWRAKNKLPAYTYVAIIRELERRHRTAPPELWSMLPAVWHRDLRDIVRKLPGPTSYGAPGRA